MLSKSVDYCNGELLTLCQSADLHSPPFDRMGNSDRSRETKSVPCRFIVWGTLPLAAPNCASKGSNNQILEGGGLYKLFTSAVVGCLATLWFTGCSGSSSNSMDATDPNAPITGTVSGTGNPQVASFSVTLPKAGNVSVEFGPDTSYAFSTSEQHTPATGTPSVTFWSQE